MNITCPTNSAEEIPELLKAGATEFYLGYTPRRYGKAFSSVASNNRRYHANSSFSDIQEITRAVRAAGKAPVHLALNSPYYTPDQYPAVLQQIRQAATAGISSIILADIPLLVKVRRQFPQLGLIVSTVASSFNSSSARFYASLGAYRLVLPRHLTVDEIRKLRIQVNMELEVLGLFDWCINDDGLCTFHHGMEKILGVNHGCMYVNDYQLEEGNAAKNRLVTERIRNFQFENFCAGCLLPQFREIGLNSIKIAGRSLPTETKVRAVQFLKRCLTTEDHDQLYFDTFLKRHPLNANAYA